MEEEKKYKAFISYARRDGELTAKKLYEDLLGMGYEIWRDHEYIRYGKGFDSEIQKGIRYSDYFIMLLTPGSVRDDGFCLKELGYALNVGVPVIPIMLLGCISPVHIANAHYIDMRTDYRQALAALLKFWGDAKTEGMAWRKPGEPPYREPDLFIGRVELLNQLGDCIRAKQPGLHLLTGEREAGKTTVLRKVQEIARKAGMLPLFADFSYTEGAAVPADPIGPVLRSLWAQLLAESDSARRYHHDLEGSSDLGVGGNLVYLRHAMMAAAETKTVVLLLDNLHLDTSSREGPFHLWLRRSFGDRALIFATYWDLDAAPDFCRASYPVRLLDERDLRTALEPDQWQLARIWHTACGGQPAAAQEVMKYWIETGLAYRAGERFTAGDVEMDEGALPDYWTARMEAQLAAALSRLHDAESIEVDDLQEWLLCAALESSGFDGDAVSAACADLLDTENARILVKQLATGGQPVLVTRSDGRVDSHNLWRFQPDGLRALLLHRAAPSDIAHRAVCLFDAIIRRDPANRPRLLALAALAVEMRRRALLKREIPDDQVWAQLAAGPEFVRLKRAHGLIARETRINSLRLQLSLLPDDDYAARWPLLRDLGIAMLYYEPMKDTNSVLRAARRAARRVGVTGLDLAHLAYWQSFAWPRRREIPLAWAWQTLPDPLPTCCPGTAELQEWTQSALRRIDQGDLDTKVLCRFIGDLLLRAMGVLALECRQLDEAEWRCQEAELLLRGAGDLRGLGKLLVTMGTLAFERLQLDEAERRYQEANLLLSAENNRRDLAILLKSMGDLALVRGHPDQAEKCYADAEPLERAEGDPRQLGGLLISRGGLAQIRGLLDQAEKHYTEAELLLRAQVDPRALGNLLHMMGDLARVRGQLTIAEARFVEAEPLLRGVGDPRALGGLLHTMGVLAFNLGQLEEAGKHYTEAEPLLRAAGDPRDLGVLLHRMGDLAAARGQIDQAGKHYTEAELLLRGADRPRPLGRLLCAMGKLARNLEKWDEATKYFAEAKALLGKGCEDDDSGDGLDEDIVPAR